MTIQEYWQEKAQHGEATVWFISERIHNWNHHKRSFPDMTDDHRIAMDIAMRIHHRGGKSATEQAEEWLLS